MTSARESGDDRPVRGALRLAATRIARMERLAIPPTERLTATERLLARLALTRKLD